MSNSNLASLYAILGTYLVLIIGLVVFLIICNWRIFTKAGQPGWKCLIPIYGSYIDYVISWNGGIFFVTLILSILSSFIKNIYVVLIIAIIQLILILIKQIKLGKRFGKGGAFSFFLLFLLPFIGYPILAFGSADYDESRSM